MEKEIESNKKLWDELTDVHLKGSDIYPIDEFKNGLNTLKDIELQEVGNVNQKNLLHLQCHFGMDTLSWARLGANVVGVDFSEKAIHAAERFSREIGVDATFINSDIFSLPEKLNQKFDIVFASYGALYWIPDLEKWCKVASSFLNSGGFLYIIDSHPIQRFFEENKSAKDLSEYNFSYFDTSSKFYESGTDYADLNYTSKSLEIGWHFTVSDLINAIAKSGLCISFFNEFPYSKVRAKAWETSSDNYPVFFSVKATKAEPSVFSG
jgi:2-polyprenyl-3-methyl-5-hydroxy-6-metoxy-1,4-benzoquinol methylase